MDSERLSVLKSEAFTNEWAYFEIDGKKSEDKQAILEEFRRGLKAPYDRWSWDLFESNLKDLEWIKAPGE
ncbi:MAG: hypothetical protein AAF653_05900, partial [Chloroflexota bacterium]